MIFHLYHSGYCFGLAFAIGTTMRSWRMCERAAVWQPKLFEQTIMNFHQVDRAIYHNFGVSVCARACVYVCWRRTEFGENSQISAITRCENKRARMIYAAKWASQSISHILARAFIMPNITNVILGVACACVGFSLLIKIHTCQANAQYPLLISLFTFFQFGFYWAFEVVR